MLVMNQLKFLLWWDTCRLGDAQGYDYGKCPIGDIRFKNHIPYNFGGRRFELFQSTACLFGKNLIRTIRPLKLFPVPYNLGGRRFELFQSTACLFGRNLIRTIRPLKLFPE